MKQILCLIYLPLTLNLVTLHSTFSQNLNSQIISNSDSLFSNHLNRNVKLTLLRPVDRKAFSWSVLLMFDGQDFHGVQVEKALINFQKSNPSVPLLIVGIEANKDRIYEYGTAGQADYAHRGNKAKSTTSFVMDELVPFLKDQFPVSANRKDWGIAGFSLGGLMALDIAWHYSEIFSKTGVFSGSFWWRSKALDDGYHDNDRIMHKIIRDSIYRPPLSFWFQTGTLDETDDRDGDGIIDSIDDTLDLIAELERKHFVWGKDVYYREVEGGEHNQKTWAQVFPEFLEWSYSK